MTNLKNFKLYTHAGCLDGSATAILFMHAGGLRKNIRFVPAGKVEDNLSVEKLIREPFMPILMVDVAPHGDELAQVLSNRTDTYVIDHHASSKRFAGLEGFIIDVNNNACGCENFRKWLVEHRIMPVQGWGMIDVQNNPGQGFDSGCYRRFTTIVDDHDRWQLKIPFSLELPKMFSILGQEEFIDRFLNVTDRFIWEKESYFEGFEIDMMKLIARSQERKFRSIIQRSFTIVDREFNGQKFKMAYVISSEVNCSELLQRYLDANPDVDVACQINLERQKLSLRSNGKVDMTEFAGHFGGGGHKTSAGHPLPDGIVAKIAELIHG